METFIDEKVKSKLKKKMHKVKLFHTINGNLNRIYCNKIWKRLRCTSDANDDSSTGNNNKCKATEGFRGNER